MPTLHLLKFLWILEASLKGKLGEGGAALCTQIPSNKQVVLKQGKAQIFFLKLNFQSKYKRPLGKIVHCPFKKLGKMEPSQLTA